jgi:antibiotic biosynthesis monooxygenase (ABM) superfamily enzyme
MFQYMQKTPGFLGAEMLPPHTPGEEYQVVVILPPRPTWRLGRLPGPGRDAPAPARGGRGRAGIPQPVGPRGLVRPAVVPASMHPPRARMALVTWMGIFPTVSLFLWLIEPLVRPHLPFLPRRRCSPG